MAKGQKYPVQAAITSLKTVEAIRELDGAGVSELAEHLSMPKSTVHDHLQSLTEAEYLIRRDGRYYVGTKFLELGGYARHRMLLYQVGHPEVEKLADETGEHSNLMIEEYGKGIFLYYATGEDAVRLDTHAGMRVHLQTTALGKTILAHLPDERVGEILDRHGLPRETANTITDRDELFDELEEVREQGYAVDDEERVEGMRCVAAPIVGSNDRVLGAVSVSGPTSRMKDYRLHSTLPDKVISAANVIEVNSTHTGQFL